MKAADKPPTVAPGEWAVDVRFTDKNTLRAHASGVLLVPPAAALALVTDAAGDALFRVVERAELPAADDGARRCAVVNRAGIRVLAWKIWTTNRVVYEISPPAAAATPQPGTAAARRVAFRLESSNVLNSLSGTWVLEQRKIHCSALPGLASSAGASSKSGSSGGPLFGTLLPQLDKLWAGPSAAGPKLTRSPQIQLSRGRSRSCSGRQSSQGPEAAWPRGLAVDEDGNITATHVTYEQSAQPKGLPPGVRYVPGMSDAVRISIGREVRQMLEKLSHASQLAVSRGLAPSAALSEMAAQLEAAGGSFKRLKRQLAASQHARAPRGAASHGSSCGKATCVGGEARIVSSHPLLISRPLELDDDYAAA